MGMSGQRYAPAALYPRERTPGTHWTGCWVGPRAGLDTDDRGKILCPCRGSNPDRPVVQPVVRHYTAWAIPTSNGLERVAYRMLRPSPCRKKSNKNLKHPSWQKEIDGNLGQESITGYWISDEYFGVAQSVWCLSTDWKTEVWSPAEAKDFSSSLCIQSRSEIHPASSPMGTGVLFLGVKLGRVVTLTTHFHLLPQSKMSRRYTPLPLRACMA
jgi:hypothetical protein